MDIEYVRSRFIKHFDGTTGSVYASPGRINLIGEHTDYNGGFVFPGAVDKGMIAEIKPNGTDKVCFFYNIKGGCFVHLQNFVIVSFCHVVL
jgi:galactokinase